ncbi:MAG TPA: WecB/TagA/CpsF family glycosyltransferase [Actinomycetota bacterium]|nr:WecB/TagA/CpsF family glycosyltransferase [Actinomycetota bacterium]
MERSFPTIDVLDVPVARLMPDEALERIAAAYAAGTPAVVAYANAHTLNLASGDPGYAEVLRRAAIVLNDGSGIALAARIQGSRFPANLNGSDFNPRIVGLAAARGWPVYFLGARPGVAERAAAAMGALYPGLVVSGCRDGYWSPEQNGIVVESIRASGAGLVMAALGNPLQEEWLDSHLAATGAALGVGVGAFFDFAAGEVPRAPAWMNRWGIEWVFRLAHEPARLWRRYIVGNPLFLARVVRRRLSGGPSS